MGMEDGADFRWMGAQCYLVAQARLRLLMLRFDGVGGCAACLWSVKCGVWTVKCGVQCGV